MTTSVREPIAPQAPRGDQLGRIVGERFPLADQALPALEGSSPWEAYANYNAGAALVAAGVVDDLDSGIERAARHRNRRGVGLRQHAQRPILLGPDGVQRIGQSITEYGLAVLRQLLAWERDFAGGEAFLVPGFEEHRVTERAVAAVDRAVQARARPGPVRAVIA